MRQWCVKEKQLVIGATWW